MELTFPFSLQEPECPWVLNTAAITAISSWSKQGTMEKFYFFFFLKIFCRVILFWGEMVRPLKVLVTKSLEKLLSQKPDIHQTI